MNVVKKATILSLIPLLLIACKPKTDSTAALPTAMVAAVVPTEEPTATIEPTTTPRSTDLPPTRGGNQVAAVAATRPPATPRPTATLAVVDPAINIISPSPNEYMVGNQTISVKGLAQLNAGQTIWVSLQTADGTQIFGAEAELTSQGKNSVAWETPMDIGQAVAGNLTLSAEIISDDDDGLTVTNNINIAPNFDGAERYITMDLPTLGQNIFAGHYTHLSGEVERPGNNRITIEIYDNECRHQVAHDSFGVNGSGNWYGLPTLPVDAEGAACVLVYAGTPGDDNWRAYQTKVTILPKDHPSASGVTIIRPLPEFKFNPGDTVHAFGIIYNAVDLKARVRIFSEDGQVLAEQETAVGRSGYWDADILLPPDVSGVVVLDVITGEAGDFGHAENEVIFTINKPAGE